MKTRTLSQGQKDLDNQSPDEDDAADGWISDRTDELFEEYCDDADMIAEARERIAGTLGDAHYNDTDAMLDDFYGRDFETFGVYSDLFTTLMRLSVTLRHARNSELRDMAHDAAEREYADLQASLAPDGEDE